MESSEANHSSRLREQTARRTRPGQVMGEYVVVPRSVREDPAKFDRLLRQSIAYVSSMPPKPKRRKSPA